MMRESVASHAQPEDTLCKHCLHTQLTDFAHMRAGTHLYTQACAPPWGASARPVRVHVVRSASALHSTVIRIHIGAHIRAHMHTRVQDERARHDISHAM
eukprot:15550302-Heterocapsa_arctica.AAC.1